MDELLRKIWDIKMEMDELIVDPDDPNFDEERDRLLFYFSQKLEKLVEG